MKYCDYCGKITLPSFVVYDEDLEDIWNKEYDLRVKRLNEKSLWYNLTHDIKMPFWPSEEDEKPFGFCNMKCYAKWKKYAQKRFQGTRK